MRALPSIILYLIPTIVSTGLALYGLRRRTAEARPFSLLMAAVAVWSLCHTMSVAAPTIAWALFWAQVQYAGVVAVGPSWVWFALVYAHRWRRWHFVREPNGTIDFPNEYLKPFALRFTDAIRAAHPSAMIFLEGVPHRGHPHWGAGDPPNTVNAAHWYDVRTLLTKHYDPDITLDWSTRQPITGEKAVVEAFAAQLGHAKQAGIEEMGGIPTVVGEFGIPFDLDDKAAYLSGDFSTHVAALDAYIDGMDAHLLNYTIWNYTSDNTNQRGDLWNDEDLSIFSRDQQADPADLNAGGRRLAGFVRPYARKTAGTPQQMRWDLATRTFEFTWQPDPAIEAPTEIFVPAVQYPDGYRVELSAGSYRQEPGHLRLLIETLDQREPVMLRLLPAQRSNPNHSVAALRCPRRLPGDREQFAAC